MLAGMSACRARSPERIAPMAAPDPGPTNRLIREKSPYLLQHAGNPVDWYPWGEEAFVKARRQEKLIFLSIGYSTCHWCHVMERESFSDPSVAAILNEHFVSIKVDREERPDVDQLYMQAVMQLTGQGGWPLTVFLTPDLKPFHGGTYFPPEDRWGRPGLKSLLRGVNEAWQTRRQEVVQAGQALTDALQAQAAGPGGRAALTDAVLRQAVQEFTASYDEQFGGFEPAPKFPRSHSLSFLLRQWRRTGDARLLTMVEQTLRAMASGGIYDHVGGGFHRYSTDARWRVPHFEKMLYDQAILAKTYLEAYQATGEILYADVARGIFEYVLRDLTGPEGAFYSAEDADSVVDPTRPEEKAEGAFYLWTKTEWDAVVGSEQALEMASLYGVEPSGNAPEDPMGEFRGKNILYQARPLQEVARERGKSEAELARLVAEAKTKLFTRRGKRPRPHRDDKILVDWNGLMISSLAFGAQVLDEPRYTKAAERAAQFLLRHLVRPDGRLLHRYRDGEAGILGMLEDYAFFIHGLVDLYQATFEPRYLSEAKRLTAEMLRLFWDDSRGGFFLTGSDAEVILSRQKEVYDGAIPSGNSVAALGMLRVARLTMEAALEGKAQALLEHFSAAVTQRPSAYPQLLIALDFALGSSYEIVIAGSPDAPATRAMVRQVFHRFLPNAVVILHPPGSAGEAIEALVPFVKDQVAVGGQPTAYVCQQYVCRQPVTSLNELDALLTGS